MSEYVTNKAYEIATASGATLVAPASPRRGDFDARIYQTAHTTGGTIMGASVYPHNVGYNPTGPLAALALRLGDDLKCSLERPRQL